MPFIFIVALLSLGYIIKQRKIKSLENRLLSIQNKNDALERQTSEIKEATSTSDADWKQMELLSIVATQTENAIMIMDPDGNIKWLNDGFTRMYGYTYDEFVATRGSNIRETSFSGIIDERLRRCKTSGEPVLYDAPNTTKYGGDIWTHTTLTPILNDKGEVTHLATIDTDIHKRKMAADILLKELAVLRSRLNELTSHQKKVENVISDLLGNQAKSGKEVEETHSIVKFINDMSDRVKIMGLNASIEAASIGNNGYSESKNNSGAGFRVLANEIIKMSEETKVHSGEISNVIDRLSTSFECIESGKTEVETATDQYLRTIKLLEDGLQKVEEVAETLNG